MKNEIKILIAAIVVILIVLVGAFALSGSNTPQATATPTVLPVTATPTPVPDGSGSTASATPVPSVAPTATPVPTPTPMPESGVKLTEFGYWITYPPLDAQTWSTNPPPVVGHDKEVYFDPTSATLSPESIFEPNSLGDSGERTAWPYIYRKGNLSETTVVTIHVTSSGNMANSIYGDDVEADLIRIDYLFEVSCGENLTRVGQNDYEVVFGPGVTEQHFHVHVYPYDDYAVTSPEEVYPEGWVKLSITDADGYYVSAADFNVDVRSPVTPYSVTFTHESGYMNSYGQIGTIMNMSTFGGPEGIINCSIQLYRSDDLSGPLTVPLYYSHLNASYTLTGPGEVTFPAGENYVDTWLWVPQDFVVDGYGDIITVTIGSPGSMYRIDPYERFYIDINQPGIP